MSESKHTPGPWTQGWSKSGIDCVWLDGKTEPEIGMGDDDEWIDCGTEANARLIAAAPDLLNALEAVLNEFAKDGHGGEFEDGEHPYVDAARAAIAKATGQT